MPEAMKKIRAELGKDAVILNSKVVYTGGFLGLFRKKNIEVIAAIDKVTPFENRISETQPFEFKGKERREQVYVPPHKEIVQPSKEVVEQISELKEMIKNLTQVKGSIEGITYPNEIQQINYLLMEQEMAPHIREDLLQSLLENWFKVGAKGTKEDVLLWCKEKMLTSISHLPFGEMTFQKKFVNVVGPTGVGKTTTLAKIAADCILNDRKKVALITTDTYRIAAIEQLKTYAKILSIPLEVCYNLDDFRHACEKFASYDVVLIDTAGRNFRNKEYVDDLSKIIDFSKEMETFLVLSLTAKEKDMEEIIEQFSIIPIDQFIFTKLDETSTYGSMYNLMKKYNKGIAYITNGQNVPDDRIAASAELVISLILGDGKNERSS